MAEEKKNYVPIYYESPESAYRDGVSGPLADAFRASFLETDKCVTDIYNAIGSGFSPETGEMYRKAVEGVMERHGREMVDYVLASFIRSRYDAADIGKEYSEDITEWAKGIRISDSYMVSHTIIIERSDAAVNAFAETVRALESEETKDTEDTPEEEASSETADSDEAPATEKTPAEKEIPVSENMTLNPDGSLTVKMPQDAVIRAYATSAVLCMPRNQGYDMYRYMVDAKNLKENGDGTVDVTLATDLEHCLRARRRGQETKIPFDKLCEIYGGASPEDYIPVKHEVTFPSDAVQGNYPNMVRCVFPDDSTYAGQHVVIPAIFKEFTLVGSDVVKFSIPDYMNFSVRDENGDDILIPASALAKEVNGGTYEKLTKWTHVTLPKEALLHTYDRHTLFKMPKGDYDGFVYYLPNGMVPASEDGSIKARIPEDRKIEIRNGATGEKKEMPLEEWLELVDGKTSEDYVTQKRKLSDAADREFLETVNRIKKTVPEDMIQRPNWIPVRIRKGDGRIQKYAVSMKSDIYPSSSAIYHNIGGDFDAAADAGVKAEASLMGFCFDKGCGIGCLELDGCLDDKGEPVTEKAKEILENWDGVYVEKSVSGKGLHVFGKVLEAKPYLPKEGEGEMFAASGYVTLTGDAVKTPEKLAYFDDVENGFFAKYFDEVKDIKEPDAADRKVLDKLMNAKNGDDFDKIFHGENIKGGEEFGDMSLAMRLTLAAKGDKKAAMRLYNASGREKLPTETLIHLTDRAYDAVADNLKQNKKAPTPGK